MSSKMTLLAMVQNILNAMESDEVNSISDTVESLAVANVVKETYFELFANTVELSQKGLVPLTNVSDVTRPNCLLIPDNCVNVDWIRYNGKLVVWRDPEDFLTAEQFRADVATVPLGFHATFSDRDPTVYTTFDNTTLVFDSWNASESDTLIGARTVAWGQLDYDFRMEDGFIPALDANRFPGFLAEAKSVCFTYFKQVSSSKDEQRSRRQKVRYQNNRWRAGRETYEGPDYGRRGGYGKTRTSPTRF